MDHMSYTFHFRGYQRTRGFRLNLKRFSVQRFRAKLFKFVRILVKAWRSCCSSVYAKKTSRSCNKVRDWSSPRSSVATNNVNQSNGCRSRSFGRSNSFYAEAIADCLEFIKNSSVSLDDKSNI
ncbi:hypothetical protein Ccrd_005827 [Cynara cardunculus var. scolymus]|uniref:Uncharacterized protein n=1 Tax=Cynara cardunculus var. scolymus TaxID=59895 RepID=A0A124SBZ1_CYNCS|nr:hypothetical protein Ccrd_005827 [Cynara cardunculus var. scolymus]